MNPFKKNRINFMTESELKELRDKIKKRKEEVNLRKEQRQIESEFNSLKKKNNFDIEKIKNKIIGGVIALAIVFIVFRIISKFI